MAILVWDGPQVVGYVAINRALEQGDFTEVERARALKLHPDVARLVATGLTNVEIGQRLGKSALTVKKQLEAVFAKARVANRAELTAVVAGLPGRASGKALRA